MIGDDLRPTTNQSLEALLELQRNEVQQAEGQNRANKRFGLDCAVIVHPGNSSDRKTGGDQSVCSDLSVSGCRLIAARPLQVGDIYWLTFERQQQLPAVFARCVRCRLIREDSFEAGFQFFSEIELPDAMDEPTQDLVDII